MYNINEMLKKPDHLVFSKEAGSLLILRGDDSLQFKIFGEEGNSLKISLSTSEAKELRYFLNCMENLVS